MALGPETGIFQLPSDEYPCFASVQSMLDIILRLLNPPIHCSGYLHAQLKC